VALARGLPGTGFPSEGWRCVRQYSARSGESFCTARAAFHTSSQAGYLSFPGSAPSQLDLFDYKPTLAKYDGKPVPSEWVKDQRYAFIRPDAELFATKFKFAKHGQSGAELSEALVNLAEVVDDIAIVKSMTTDAFNHAPDKS